MKITKPRTMPGTMELLPREQVTFQRLLDRIRAGFERFGFQPIETPALELTEVLLAKGGGETEKQVYLTQSTGARGQGHEPDLALRFDLTVPLARYVAQHEGRLTFPFRRYQMQRVYRGERAQRGRYREFYQCDIDVIGRDELDPRYDAEVAAVVIGIFGDLDFGPFTVHLNNRKLLRGILEELDIPEAARPVVLREVDKIDKRGRDAVLATIAEGEAALGAERARALLELLATSGPSREVVEALAVRGFASEGARTGLAELAQLVDFLDALGVDPRHHAIQLSTVRGLDYYTGTVYETLLDEHPEIGSVCSGGRYEDLASHYTKSRLPGVGISIGLTRLFYQLQELGLVGGGAAVARVLVAQQERDHDRDVLQIAGRLRAAGVNTEVILEPWRFRKQMKYANGSGIPLLVIQGERERGRGAVTLRDMVRGQQQEIPLAELVARVQEWRPPAESRDA